MDKIISEDNKGTCMLIDVALLGDRKIIKKEAEICSNIQTSY
jgi:hypothetical protein